ncbi:kinase-like protein [Cylindrobasidium torrendii FP15055 ss-10]|uniref:non-specific serine/threonine protein kinase n=1 Tax=Cylindrobasidium torrendii FP15055 ss-10 TaxID=1314674 RepID=A0A0D7B0H2_9AGAR|nr:kinase-like protein [Cylindrobasidium torrendii FP15055 ss-10]
MYRGARALSKTMVCRPLSAFAQRAPIRRPLAQPPQDRGWLAMEELQKAYRFGGLRPTVLGENLLDGRYKILRKLGVGKQASVWLAADMHTRDMQCVAIKIYTGDASQEEAEGVREIRALQRFAEGDPVHPGSTFAGTPLDEAFLLESVNGHHLCVVTRALGPTLNVLRDAVYGGRFSEAAAQRVMHDVLQALDYCHSEGKVIHTDVKLDNVASSTPKNLTLNHPSFRTTKARSRKIGDGSTQITESQPIMDISRTEDTTGTTYTLIDFGKEERLHHLWSREDIFSSNSCT